MVQTRAQTVRNRAVKSGNQASSFTRDGPSCLKPRSSSRKRIRKRKKNELTPWPFDDPKPTTTAIKTSTMAKDKTKEAPASGPSKPSAATKTGESTSKVQKANRMSKGTQINPSTLPKDLIEQHTLSVTPQAGADMEELEEAIRSIESPCGNIVWSESWIKKRTRGGGPATLDINVIYNDCSGHRTAPYSCRKNRTAYGAANGDLPPHGEALSVEDAVRHMRGLDGLVAACEVVARRSWAVNAVSHGGDWRAA